ncbi:MAG: hypothetical protein AAF799_37180 [Myxococcota bacterium]
MSLRLARRVLWAVVLASAPACGDRSKKDEPPPKFTTEKNFKLLMTGEEPRMALRPALSVGATLEATIDYDQDLTLSSDWRSSARTPTEGSATVRLEFIDGKNDGPVAVRFAVSDIKGTRIDDADDLPNSGRATLGAWQEIDRVRFDGAPPLDAANEAKHAWMADVRRWLVEVLVPVPEEPIGVGASWTWKWDDRTGGVKVSHARTYRLDSLSEEEAVLTVYGGDSTDHFSAKGGSDLRGTIRLVPGTLGVPRSEMNVTAEMRLGPPTGKVVRGKLSGQSRLRPRGSAPLADDAPAADPTGDGPAQPKERDAE